MTKEETEIFVADIRNKLSSFSGLLGVLKIDNGGMDAEKYFRLLDKAIASADDSLEYIKTELTKLVEDEK